MSEPTYFRVTPRIWREPWSDDAKLLAFYLLTNEHRTYEGLYRLPRGYMLADLQWSAQRLAQPFRELLEDGFIQYDEETSVVFLAHALRYQAPANHNCMVAAANQLAELPETPLFAAFLEAAERYAQPFAERLPNLLPERLANSPTPTPTHRTRRRTPPIVPPKGVAEPDSPKLFDDFWAKWPNRHGSKKLAHDRFAKLSREDQAQTILAAGHVADALADGRLQVEYQPRAENFVGGSKRYFEEWADGPPARYAIPRQRTDVSAADLFAMAAVIEGEAVEVPDDAQ